MTSKLFAQLGRKSKPHKELIEKLKPKLPRTERVLYTAKINAFWHLWESYVHSRFELHKMRRDATHTDAVELFTATYQQLLQNSRLGDFIEGLGNRVVGKAVGYMRKVAKVKIDPAFRSSPTQERTWGGVFKSREAAEAQILRNFEIQGMNQASGRQAGPVVNSTDVRVVETSAGKFRIKQLVRTPRVAGRENLLQEFRDRNIALITNVGAEQAQRLNELLQNVQGFNVRHEDLAPKVQEVLDVGKSRAELIARDQTLKINSQAHEIAQRSAGIEEFIWSTSGDERVRESHQELDGQKFSWDDLPIVDDEEASPGSAINCRCVATPIISLFEGI